MTVTGIERVISGGQSGADLGALLAAEDLGIPTGGTAPYGWRTEVGTAPWLGTRFGLTEHRDPSYYRRTLQNVADSDGTLIFGDVESPGSAQTRRLCSMEGRHCLVVDWPPLPFTPNRTRALYQRDAMHVQNWFVRHGIRILNVAGNRESVNPGIQEACRVYLRKVLSGG